MSKILPILFLLNVFAVLPLFGEDYYELLGIPKNADNREIRKAFKKLALSLHPDKNKGDPEAQEKFIKVNKAYETLKKEELRKKYDLHGEKGLDDDFKPRQQYHSWNYYYENFGIYDDDPEVITLSQSDFEQNVLNSQHIWFVNYYSTMCSHCHHLAPAWRQVAREMEGVIRIGAVNCEEDWALCRNQGITSYPSLMLYPKQEKYRGDRSHGHLTEYILKNLPFHVLELWEGNFEQLTMHSDIFKDLPWLICFCDDDSDECLSGENRLKLAAMLDGLVKVAVVDCKSEAKLCKKFGMETGIAYFEAQKVSKDQAYMIRGSDAKEIASEVLSYLPEASHVDEESFEDLKTKLKLEVPPAWVVHFVSDSEGDGLEWKKLPALLPHMKIGKVDCFEQLSMCREMHVHKFPTFVVFKLGGAYEIYHGRSSAPDVANFAKESSAARNLHILTPKDFPNVIHDGSPWFIDFFAPWCPPCMRLMPEFRKASKMVGEQVHFGTVDCTLHARLCNQYNIRSYPTTILYNQSKPHHFEGHHQAHSILEFVQDVLHPPVVSLTSESFRKEVAGKPVNEIWLVDFFAPWCGPCQQLAPEWRKLAKSVAGLPDVHVAEVDCVAQSDLCSEQSIRSYPSIRLYPSGGKGISQVVMYSSYQRDSSSLIQWLFNFLPSSVIDLKAENFQRDVLWSTSPWIVDFYAPWCGHCHEFAPEFEIVAKRFEGRVKAGKVNCQAYHWICKEAGVRAYPTVKFYEGSEEGSLQDHEGETVHSQSSQNIILWLEKALEKDLLSSEEWNSVFHDEF